MTHAPRTLGLLVALVLACGVLVEAAQATTYTFLRSPRCGDGVLGDDGQPNEPLHPTCEGVETQRGLPTAPGPVRFEYTQLAAVDTETGAVRVLIDPGVGNAVIDAVPGLDGVWVYYSLCLGVHAESGQSAQVPDGGCHIERVHSETLARERLIEGGVHLSPREYQPGKLVYQWHGTPGGFRAAGLKTPSWQLAIHDIATGAGEIIGHQSIGSALHPFPLMDGSIGFNSLENQGVRRHEMWGLWTQFPDGRHWAPAWSAYQVEAPGRAGRTRHFAEQLGNGRLVITLYYEGHTSGLGTVFEIAPGELGVGRPVFGHWDRNKSEPIIGDCRDAEGDDVGVRYTYDTPNFAPHGLRNVTPFGKSADRPSCRYDDVWQGKVTHPAPDLDNGLLVTLCVGPCKGINARDMGPFMDTGIARLAAREQDDGTRILEPAVRVSDLEVIHDEREWNEWYPRVLASYQAIYGQPAPDPIPFLPRSPRAQPGDPVGWIGASSTCHADVLGSPSVNRDGETVYTSAWLTQGIDPPYDCESVVGMRIVAFEPHLADGTGDRWGQLHNYSEERIRILGEVPIEADGSWLALVPADQPLGFGPVNAAGDMLVPPATWKKVSPGEDRHDCGGCHAHSKQPVPFAGTLADAAAYSPHDVAYQTPLLEAVGQVIRAERFVDLEWARDIASLFPGQTYKEVVEQIRAHKPGRWPTRLPDSARSPLVTTEAFLALPEPSQRQVRRWINNAAPHTFGFVGWFVDEYPPTLALELVGDRLYVGAYDLHDETVVPEVRIDGGEPLALMPVEAGRRWVAEGVQPGLVHAVATDASGNVRTIKRVIGATATEPTEPEPPDCPTEPVPECPVHTVQIQCPEADGLECLIER